MEHKHRFHENNAADFFSNNQKGGALMMPKTSNGVNCETNACMQRTTAQVVKRTAEWTTDSEH